MAIYKNGLCAAAYNVPLTHVLPGNLFTFAS